MQVASAVFKQVDRDTELRITVREGARVEPGTVAGVVRGKVRSLLMGERTALSRRMCYYCKYPLDLSRMAQAAGLLLGEHDFTSFAPISLGADVSPVCTVSAASVRGDGAAILFDVTADRFLHHMVRTVVGTLIEVGRGRIPPERVGEILCKRDRRAAGPTVPACGLVLMEVFYPQ